MKVLRGLFEGAIKIPLFLLFIALSVFNQIDMWFKYRRGMRDEV